MTMVYAHRRAQGRRPAAPRPLRGNWKMAYADFLTALMAFFMVLWITQGVSDDDRAALADYFASNSTVPASQAPAEMQTDPLSARFAAAIDSGRLSIASTADTVRIEVMDRTSAPLFASAQHAFTKDGAALIAALTPAIQDTPGTIQIEGHTDAFPAAPGAIDNWTLSTARALEARQVLVSAGLSEHRITGIAGLADTAPLNPGEPHLSANRRISILLDRTAVGD